MKFKFPLQKVLEHRKVREGLAQREFQEALGALNQAMANLQDMQFKKKEALRLSEVFTSRGGAASSALWQANDFIKGQEIRIQQQQLKVKEAEKLVEEKRELLRQSVQEYKVIERVREIKLEEFKNNRDLQEQKEMDEQSILRFKTVKESK
jgi:flagellar FliJ protein